MADEEAGVTVDGAGGQKTSSGNAKTTLITVIGSVLVAAITTWGTIHATGTKINENSEKLDQLKQQAEDLSNPSVPVGTIVASILTREQFAKATGDPENLDAKTRKWALANGKNIDGTDYVTATGKSELPNLQGVFLRGKSNGRTDLGDIKDVELGVYTADVVGPHDHPEYVYNKDHGSQNQSGILWNGPSNLTRQDMIMTWNPGGENIPKNVTVNYYIRINK